MKKIHPTAIISPQATIEDDVCVGPFSIIIGKVKIGAGTQLGAHVQIGNNYGRVVLGRGNKLFAGCIVGSEPQDLKYKQEETELIIGDRNTIREFANINTGTVQDCGVTRIGDDCLIMVSAHIGHDCQLGNKIILGNQSGLAGHVKVGDLAIVCSYSSVVQFRTLGNNSYLTPYSVANKDILPFSIARGEPAVMKAINKIGLERNGYAPEEIANIKKALNYLIRVKLTVQEAIEEIQSQCQDSESIKALIEFVQKSKKGIARQ